jgi:hypothetical protein
MTIADLLADPARRDHAAMPESDALTDIDGLQEADLVDVCFDARESTLVMLLDLRTALQFRLANTAVLAMRDVRHVEWNGNEPERGSRVAHYVMSSKPSVTGGRITIEIACLGGWRLAATASSAEFYVGDVPGLPKAPPNFARDDETTIAAGMPRWASTFEPAWATFIDRLD